jgi:DNA-binding CsgD family transcriptional regulator
MHDNGPPVASDLLHVTARRAEVLALLADGATLPEVAAQMGVSVNGVRSHVEDLKKLTGCTSTRQLGRWWRANRRAWLELMATVAGCEPLR